MAKKSAAVSINADAPPKEAVKPKVAKLTPVTSGGAKEAVGDTKKSATDALLKAVPSGFPTRPVAGVVPYNRNARVHSPEQVNELKNAMRKFGYTQPVITDEKGLLAGHGRLMAVKEIYAEGGSLFFAGSKTPIPPGHIPFIDVSGLTEAERREYIIWDNKSAEKSSWDFDMLGGEMAELAMLPDADLNLTGFSTSEIDGLLKTDGFAPSLDPTSLHKPVTDQQVTAGQTKLLGKYSGAAGQSLIDVMCPHCAKEFSIDKPK